MSGDFERWHADQLARGFDPLTADRLALLRGQVRDSMDVSGMGLESEVVAFVDLLERRPETRLVMRIARRAGIPYSEARERWKDPKDLAAELGYDALEAVESWARCPSCGIDPADVLDVDGNRRPLANGRWMFSLEECWVDNELARLNKDLTEEQRDAGMSWRIRPRRPGDPLEDRGD